MARVSVILNCYNQAKYVQEAIESVLRQTYQDFELVIVDNGSTDATPQLLRQYENDPRVRLFLHHDNCAISKRFNQAIDAARGEFISFLYSDDFFLPEKLERQVACFDTLGAEYGVVYGPPLYMNENTGARWRGPTMRYSGQILQEMLLHHEDGPLNMVSPLTRKECFAGRRFYEDVFAEGEAMFIRIAFRYKFFYQDEPLVVLRDHGSNAGKAVRVNSDMVMTCIDHWEEDPELPAGFQRYTRKYRARVLRNVGWCMLRVDADTAWARGALARSVKIETQQLFHPRTIAGFLLSWLPAGVRRGLNRMGDRVRGVRSNSVFVQGYK